MKWYAMNAFTGEKLPNMVEVSENGSLSFQRERASVILASANNKTQNQMGDYFVLPEKEEVK